MPNASRASSLIALASFPARFRAWVAMLAVLVPAAALAAPVGEWSPVLPLGGNPVGAYDPVRQRLIQVDTYGRAWALDLADDTTWTPLTGPDGPTRADRRNMFPAFYDRAGDRMLVLSGTVAALNLSGAPRWTQLVSTGDGPPERLNATAVFDSRRRRILVFGGYDSRASNEVWSGAVGQGITWTKLDLATRPLPRAGHVAVYDSLRDRMLVFGGGSSPDNCEYQDLWSLDLAGAPAWHALTATGTPPCVTKQSAVYDAARDRMLVSSRDDFHARFAVSALELSGAQSAWVNLNDAGMSGAFVAPVQQSTMVLDAAKDRLVVFVGGNVGDGVVAVDLESLHVDEIGAVDAPPGNTPALALGMDPRNGDPFFASPGLFITLDRADRNHWRRRNVSTPPNTQGSGGAFVVDRKRARIVHFGGRVDALGHFSNTVLTLPLDGSAPWTTLPTSGTPPSPRTGCTAVYDARRDRMLVYGGGFPGDGRSDSAVYVLQLANSAGLWSVLPVAGAPPGGRMFHAAVYDPLRDRMLVFLGEIGSFSWGDSWALNLGGDVATWEPLLTAGEPPPPRGRHGVYDPVHDRVLLVGGDERRLNSRVDELSMVPGSAWEPVLAASAPPGPQAPNPFGYDPVRGELAALASNPFSFDPSETTIATWLLPLGAPPGPTIQCLSSTELTPGKTLSLGYAITNPGNAGETVEWTLTSAHPWPGLPKSSALSIPAHGEAELYVNVTVPDSLPDGASTLTLTARMRGSGVTLTGITRVGDPPGPPPGTSGFQILLAGPNPTVERWQVALDLPTGGTADVELFDITGRRVESQSVADAPPGRLVFSLGREIRSPGVYTARVHHAGETRTLRLIRIR